MHSFNSLFCHLTIVSIVPLHQTRTDGPTYPTSALAVVLCAVLVVALFLAAPAACCAGRDGLCHGAGELRDGHGGLPAWSLGRRLSGRRRWLSWSAFRRWLTWLTWLTWHTGRGRIGRSLGAGSCTSPAGRRDGLGDGAGELSDGCEASLTGLGPGLSLLIVAGRRIRRIARLPLLRVLLRILLRILLGVLLAILLRILLRVLLSIVSLWTRPQRWWCRGQHLLGRERERT